jgi:transposase
MGLLRAHRTTLARLRRFFGLGASEKTACVLDEAQGAAPQNGGDPAAGDKEEAEGKPPKPKGHGRVPTSEYEAATHIPVSHQSLAPGSACPGCACGKLYDLKEPARLLRIVGQPLLAALCWDLERLRCSACGHVYTAQAPKEAQGPKFDETAVSMLALCRYSAGLPLHRIEQLQGHLQTPIPSSTQWDVLEQSVPAFQPVYQELAQKAAQAELVHDDDTYVRILSFMGKRRAQLLKSGDLPDPERTGLFTTAILSITKEGPIALFRTGRKYAGENLGELLTSREADRAPPILMSDALDSRNVPKGHAVVEANCTAHARRGIVDQVDNFPTECTYVLTMLRKVFVIDARCKREGLSPGARLLVHQAESGPVMDALHLWLSEQFTEKRVEPNSGLGKAYGYLLKRWHKLTLFLRQAGAPLDNNICERALKKAIVHRRNSLFYRSQHGADVGDLFMSLIYTAELRGQNPFDYLTQVQRHERAVAQAPADWLPWTYKKTLARLAQKDTDSRASPPPGSPSLRSAAPPAPSQR